MKSTPESQPSGSSTNGSNNTGNRANIDSNTKKIPGKFPKLFNGIGCLEDYEQSLHVDLTVSPIAQRPRRIPFDNAKTYISDKTTRRILR